MSQIENMPEHRSTARVLDIIEEISTSEDGYTLTELSALLDAPKSSLLPIIHTLHRRKYLSRDQYTNKYRLGLRAFRTGQRFLDQINIIGIVKEEMLFLTKACCETSFFGVLADGNSNYLVKVDSPEPIRMFASAGKQLPAYSTGLGKALLSGCSSEKLRAMYPNGLLPVTAHTILDMTELERQLEQVRKEGFAYEIEESTLQIRCVAVPIQHGGKVIAALSVATPLFRYNDEKEKLIQQALLRAKHTIEKALDSLQLNASAFEV